MGNYRAFSGKCRRSPNSLHRVFAAALCKSLTKQAAQNKQPALVPSVTAPLKVLFTRQLNFLQGVVHGIAIFQHSFDPNKSTSND
jgi:hypothetical protein